MSAPRPRRRSRVDGQPVAARLRALGRAATVVLAQPASTLGAGQTLRGRAAVKRLAALALALPAPGGGAAAGGGHRLAGLHPAQRTGPPRARRRSSPSRSLSGTDGRLRTEVLDSPALGGHTRVNVLLPKDYDPSGATRYPVLYLLHGAISDYNDWNYNGGIRQPGRQRHGPEGPAAVHRRDARRRPLRLVQRLVRDRPGSTGPPPAWSQYHIGELIPWIDETFPTVAERSGRAIAGLSMGGFGAMSYAARHPDLFAAAGSFSGALNPTYGPGYGQAFVTLASALLQRGQRHPVHLGRRGDPAGALAGQRPDLSGEQHRGHVAVRRLWRRRRRTGRRASRRIPATSPARSA